MAPYAMLEYRVSGDLSVAGRYRYNHMTHKDVNINAGMEYNDSHLLDVFVNYQATDNLWLQLNPEFSINAGDFRSPNGKRTHWEPNIAAHYQLNKHWRPFAELGWLDRDENHDNQVRVRIGIRYFLP
ncbi:oligogalacturonate-specific porin KdgM family protein [Klebsiella oxytoca]|uniref:oligogalacturonate-specific porin KdgM family protein n=1 Tax=Klebsiella oxytoca TaxID=571 RepID=UPI0022B77FF3|nr:oligogalacturonate-specific porin KdgM family protein [Klebsiella oxytoca]MDU4361417.1 oligogalacturonate-specific porin KdgM family protein [Klebsiella oxytoca]